MSRLLRASTLIGRPIVTLAGDSPFEVKDVVFDRSAGNVLGFTLRKHGFLGSPSKNELAWTDVHGMGPDAVVVADADALHRPDGDNLTKSGGNVLGDRVLTESGTDLGEVVEAIISTGSSADVVGFEIEPSEHLQTGDSQNVFLPLPDALGISGENVIVPDTAKDYISNDLSGFGGAVENFRSQLKAGN